MIHLSFVLFVEKLQLHELVGAIQSSSSNADLKKHLSKIEKNEKVLAVPLPKHEKEKVSVMLFAAQVV